MLKVKELTKIYGDRTAVDNVSFSLKAGELVGLLGLNGAGKTTTLNMLTGFLAPTRGSVEIDGVDLLKEPVRAARHIGFLPEQPPLYDEMTVKAFLGFVYELKGVRARDRAAHIAEVCESAGVSEVYTRVIGHLSRGYRQRVGLAAALTGDPDILILDEPTVGLDPKQIKDIRTLIAGLGQSRAILLSTHILPEVSATCGRVLVINNGKLAADLKLSGGAPDLEDTFMSLIAEETMPGKKSKRGKKA